MSNGPYVFREYADAEATKYRTYLESHGITQSFSSALKKVMDMEEEERKQINVFRFVAECMDPEQTSQYPPIVEVEEEKRYVQLNEMIERLEKIKFENEKKINILHNIIIDGEKKK